ncbi:MAG: 3-keto-5-aminohexanoate cleavage protein [Aigarchaeota archaeon]|nr:3-keto-5-aminohexanoate cleavage protein [Aigarchaeota archaeon]MDW8092818.1 3-keto-5-aminohexanoate cleavage protein [Nitrososphaerota archaeon]
MSQLVLGRKQLTREDRLKILEKYKDVPPADRRQLVGTRHIDFTELKRWDIPDKIIVSVAASGVFINKDQNPNQPVTPGEMVRAYEECIDIGAVGVHVHARDPETGRGVADAKVYHQIIDPLKAKYGDNIVVDGGTMAGRTFEEMMTPIVEGLFEIAIVNPSTGILGNWLRHMHPKTTQAQARFFQECGVKPQIDVHDGSSIELAKRFLIDPGLIEKPTYWHVLPGLPGTYYIPNEIAMVEAIMWFVRRIREIDREAVIMVSDTSRSCIYMPVLATLLGLHIRVGMEDTIWRYPHKDELIESNKEIVESCITIARHLGREPATADEYRRIVGIKK